MNINQTQTQKSAMLFSEVGLYNQKVQGYLKATSLNAITQHTIKIFKDNAQRNKLSESKYNQAVEEFNSTHGFLLLKKGATTCKKIATKHYAYINYPYLDREAMKKTMDNYRQFVYKYNQQAIKENKEIKAYNTAIVKTTCADILKQIIDFKAQYHSEFTQLYNELAEKHNTQLGANYIAKKRIPTIKYTSELVFSVLVGFYISQLKKRNEYLLEMNRPTSTLKNALPKLQIDHRKLATHTIADIPRFDFCKKTAQNHIKRLREAGILINYTYINQNKPIAVNFCPKILVILDGNLPKSQNAENKDFIASSGKKLPHNNDTTRTILLKEKEIKDCANSTVSKKESNAYPADGYKNTTGISKELKNHPRKISAELKTILPDFLGGNKKAPQNTHGKLTDNFLSLLQDDRELAQELAQGKFDNYKGLRYEYLKKIELYAHVTIDEFRAILIQDFIKSSAKIWKQHPVYVGEWKKAINHLNDTLFKGFLHKSTLNNKLKEYRWKLNFARKWFAKSEVPALYPSFYFDTTRTQANEIGFYGLKSVWKTHQKYVLKRQEEKAQKTADKNARRRKLSAQEKLTKAVRKYKEGIYNVAQLYSYVQTNLPNDYLVSLPTLLKNQQIA